MLAIDSPKKGARAELSDIEKVVANNPELIRLLPAVPKLKRTFSAESQSLAFSMNASSDRRHGNRQQVFVHHGVIDTSEEREHVFFCTDG